MKTVIKNSAQVLCLPLALTPRFSEVDQPLRRLASCFNSFPRRPTQSEYIRSNPTNFFTSQPTHSAERGHSCPQQGSSPRSESLCPVRVGPVKKSARKSYLFNFI